MLSRAIVGDNTTYAPGFADRSVSAAALQVHDLLQVEPDSFLAASVEAPPWVREILTSCPWVVVRRAAAPAGQHAIGVRGSSRSERWGGLIGKDTIVKLVRPSQLLAVVQSSAFRPRMPPFTALQQLIERWRDLSFPWGPTGSVGFELATGCAVTTNNSDLDIVIRAESRLCLQRARSLCERAKGLQTKLDIRVETPECGFSLEEYAFSSSAILLRYPVGFRLGNDPWAKNAQAVQGAL